MNLDSVNTVSDLLQQNEQTKTPFETVTEGLTKCDYEETKKVILWLTGNMLEFHQERSLDPNTENSHLWCRDVGRLEVCFQTLRDTL
jgi:hypothetical protein